MQDKHKIEAVVCGLSSRDPRTKCEEKSGNERRRRNEVLISVRDKVQWMSWRHGLSTTRPRHTGSTEILKRGLGPRTRHHGNRCERWTRLLLMMILLLLLLLLRLLLHRSRRHHARPARPRPRAMRRTGFHRRRRRTWWSRLRSCGMPWRPRIDTLSIMRLTPNLCCLSIPSTLTCISTSPPFVSHGRWTLLIYSL